MSRTRIPVSLSRRSISRTSGVSPTIGYCTSPRVAGMSRRPTQSKPASTAHDTISGGVSSSTDNAARPIGCAMPFRFARLLAVIRTQIVLGDRAIEAFSVRCAPRPTSAMEEPPRDRPLHRPTRRRYAPTIMDHRLFLRVVAPLVVAAILSVPSPSSAEAYSGTAFEVSDEGHLLTNHHVVASCKAIHIKREGLDDVVQLVASDAQKDLAVLFDPSRMADRISYRKMTGGAPQPYARFPVDEHYLLYG